jgi:hypothetical protein
MFLQIRKLQMPNQNPILLEVLVQEKMFSKRRVSNHPRKQPK